MSDIVNGVFLITPHPPGFVETLITRNGVEQPLTLDPPGVAGRQEWLVREVEGSGGKYTLTRLGGEPAEGFSWEGKDPRPGSPVLLGEPKPFFLTKLAPHFKFRSIQPGIIIVGAAYYVDHQASKVQFVDFPIINEPPPEAPMWMFTPIH
ncbi:hypothetical protein BD779DRAFT_1677713 [Infundibulicybe gibba]|nr:hypothetical protein BD779DRAFT_1677713 [Infundibulicybe gibba]